MKIIIFKDYLLKWSLYCFYSLFGLMCYVCVCYGNMDSSIYFKMLWLLGINDVNCSSKL